MATMLFGVLMAGMLVLTLQDQPNGAVKVHSCATDSDTYNPGWYKVVNGNRHYCICERPLMGSNVVKEVCRPLGCFTGGAFSGGKFIERGAKHNKCRCVPGTDPSLQDANQYFHLDCKKPDAYHYPGCRGFSHGFFFYVDVGDMNPAACVCHRGKYTAKDDGYGFYYYVCAKPTKRVDEDKCNAAQKVIGDCKASLKRWSYNPSTGKCEKFMYGGCRGSANNFDRKIECKRACFGKCETKYADGGRCRGAWEKYSYNQATGECVKFTYGGCGGSSNRFNTMDKCQELCMPSSNDKRFLPIIYPTK